MPRYVDSANVDPMAESVGVGFLIERSHLTKGGTTWLVDALPARTNQSDEPRLNGWCGTTNDIHVSAHGLARVGPTTPNHRTEIMPITDPEEIRHALATLAFPELAP